MLLESITIHRDTYGATKGSYDVVIRVSEECNEIKLKLPPEMSHAFVEQCKELIHKFSVRAADQLHRDLLLSEPEKPKEISG